MSSRQGSRRAAAIGGRRRAERGERLRADPAECRVQRFERRARLGAGIVAAALRRVREQVFVGALDGLDAGGELAARGVGGAVTHRGPPARDRGSRRVPGA